MIGVARVLVMMLVLLPIALWAVLPLVGVEERPVSPALWELVVISALSNLYILYFHYSTPPHPKFVMLKARRFWLRVHIVSGSLEFLAGLLLLMLPGRTWPGLLMAITALAFHVPSSFAQNRIVAGSRALMVPTYIAGISIHAFCAAMLLVHPNSVFWAVNTFLLFNTYAWVRIYGFAFQKLELFADSRYTVMVLAAGVTTMTPVLGPIWPVQLGLFLVVYILAYRLLFARERADYLNFVRDHDRWSAISKEATELWADKKGSPGQVANAREVFDHFDEGRTGTLGTDVLRRLLTAWSLPKEAFAALIPAAGEGEMDFDTFVRDVWSLGSVRNRAALAVDIGSRQSVRDKAQLTFDILDLDGDGYLNAFELELLLLEWNLPSEEARRYIAVSDRDGDGRIDFEDYYRNMRPVWKFLFYNVLGPQMVSNNLLGAGELANQRQDARQTLARYEHTKAELVGSVQFLRDASPALLRDVAESLEERRLEVGETLFAEWDRGDRFFIVVDGEIELTRAGQPLCVMGPGASFGETALLLEGPRSATATAASHCLLYALSRSSFDYLLERHPTMATVITELSTTWRRERIQSGVRQLLGTAFELPELVTAELLAVLGEQCSDHRVPAGETIFEQGDEGDRFYIIHSGLVSVRRDEVELVRRTPGSCFGEIALLDGSPRNAAVVAVEDTVLFSLDREAFQRALATYPQVEARLEAIAAARR